MKKIIIMLITFSTILACIPKNTPITYPPGSTLCRTDYDCFEGQHCGFVPGYTAAVCRDNF